MSNAKNIDRVICPLCKKSVKMTEKGMARHGHPRYAGRAGCYGWRRTPEAVEAVETQIKAILDAELPNPLGSFKIKDQRDRRAYTLRLEMY